MNLSLPKLLFIFALVLFAIIGILSIFKKSPSTTEKNSDSYPIEIVLEEQPITAKSNRSEETLIKPEVTTEKTTIELAHPPVLQEQELPDADRINEFFQLHEPKFPIVETVTYKSHVNWLKGRPAWLSDYASHYQTSRHFIARSLNRQIDYMTQEVREGNRFNVLKKDYPVQFYLLVDTTRCRLWFYYIDMPKAEKVLVKTYKVGLGRKDDSKTSGLLTPFGIYALGDRIAVYKPKMMGNYQGKRTEMITIFGTRWIPFESEEGECTAPAKGFGVHGTPWAIQSDGSFADTKKGLGLYEGDGCIRLATPDIEEIFAIVVTKPTFIEIVPDFFKAKFNGKNNH